MNDVINILFCFLIIISVKQIVFMLRAKMSIYDQLLNRRAATLGLFMKCITLLYRSADGDCAVHCW